MYHFRPLLLFLILSHSSICFGQYDPNIDDPDIVLTDGAFDTIVFNSLIERQFSKVVIGNSVVPGNYAGFDVKDAQFNGTGSMKVGRRAIFSFNINGGVSEGTAALFLDSKVNPNIGFQTRLNFLNPVSKKTISIDNDVRKSMRARMLNIGDHYKILIQNQHLRETHYRTLSSLLSDSLIQIGQVIHAVKERLENLPRPTTRTESIELQKLRMKLANLITTNFKVLQLKDSIARLTTTSTPTRLLRNERNAKWDQIPPKISAVGFSFGWFSIGYALTNRNFLLFDSSDDITAQLSKQDFTAHEISFQYYHMSWNIHKIGSILIGGGVAVSIDDNKSSLTRTEITETYTYRESPAVRSEQKKYTAFVGDYRQDLRSLRPFCEMYYFPFGSRTFALHLSPETLFTVERKPLTHIGTGLFFTFIDKKDDKGKALVNAELYAKFNDVNNNLNRSNTRFHERNEIGMRLTFPFNFNL